MRNIKNILKILVIVFSIIGILNIGIYGVAYIMKDRVSSGNARKVCRQVYEGPQNMINLISNKLLGKLILGNININKILKIQRNIEKQIESEYSELDYD